MRAVHLVRRFGSSLSPRPPSAADAAWVAAHLRPAELELWRRMSAPDRRHSIQVARRFVVLAPDVSDDEIAAALLHDVGKLRSGLGTFERVIATIAGPRTARWRRYHDHEHLGAEMLRICGSHSSTVELVLGHGRHAAALRDADDV